MEWRVLLFVRTRRIAFLGRCRAIWLHQRGWWSLVQQNSATAEPRRPSVGERAGRLRLRRSRQSDRSCVACLDVQGDNSSRRFFGARRCKGRHLQSGFCGRPRTLRALRSYSVAANRSFGKSSQGNWPFRQPKQRLQTHDTEMAGDR
jgi:hypothetical protein